MFSLNVTGSTAKTESFLKKMSNLDIASILSRSAQKGVAALEAATPIDSGLASHSWGYELEVTGSSCTIWWTNTDVESGFPVAIMLQYGYGTGTGGYVAGRDYINPAIQPIFDEIANDVWKVVTSS